MRIRLIYYHYSNNLQYVSQSHVVFTIVLYEHKQLQCSLEFLKVDFLYRCEVRGRRERGGRIISTHLLVLLLLLLRKVIKMMVDGKLQPRGGSCRRRCRRGRAR